MDEARHRMEEAVDAVRRDFSTVRTGKATPALLDTVKVDAYGSKMPLNQVASVSTPEPSLLVIQPFDKTLLPEIERAILTADLGFNPGNDGNIIRIPVPPLNEERLRRGHAGHLIQRRPYAGPLGRVHPVHYFSGGRPAGAGCNGCRGRFSLQGKRPSDHRTQSRGSGGCFGRHSGRSGRHVGIIGLRQGVPLRR